MCKPSKSGVLVSYSPPALLKLRLLVFKTTCLGGSSSQGFPRQWCPMWGLNTSFSGRTSTLVIALLVVGHQARGVSPHETMLLPLLLYNMAISLHL